jgi:prolyl oligopeptidase
MELWKIGALSKEGNFTYSKNDGLQNQSVMYRKDAAGKEEILDPNTFLKTEQLHWEE